MKTKPEFKVKNAKLVRVGEHWPDRPAHGHEYKFVLMCEQAGECESRGISDGHPIRTSMLESVDWKTGRVETMNSIYMVENFLP